MSQLARPVALLALSAFTCVGLLLVSATGWMVADNVSVMLTHEHARAEVVKSERIGSGSGKRLTYYAVEVRYNGPRGRRTAQVDRSTSNYEPGETLSIYYRPETAYKVTAGGFMNMWFLPTILGIPGLLGLFFGLRPQDFRRSPTST